MTQRIVPSPLLGADAPGLAAQSAVTGHLVLEDGLTFEGISFGAEVPVSGETVFNTGMVGYPETLTDPSYNGEILVFTYPLIGNYGVQGAGPSTPNYFESGKVQVASILVSDYSYQYHHWHAERSLGQWLKEHGVPALGGVDTRTLTKHLRERGTMLGKIEFPGLPIDFRNPRLENQVARVSPVEPQLHGSGNRRVILVDCGAKRNILECLLERGVEVLRVPWNHDISKEKYDGILLSNGPGDPQECRGVFPAIRHSLAKSIPTFGICLGHQLLALAVGANTYKLKYGHRSQNQPVREEGTDRGFVTSQNHGYAVDVATLPRDWKPWYTNLNDGTNEGIRHTSGLFFSVQFHPEAAPGPVDSNFLFDDFIKLVNSR